MPKPPPLSESPGRAGCRYSAELQELLALLFQALSGEPAALARLNRAALASLRENRLTPWLYREAVSHGWKKYFSAALLKELRHDYASALLAATRQQAELHQVLQVLGRAGLEVILLKGSDLGQRLYDDPAARPMDDLDLLISPADLPQAKAALAAKGYHLRPENYDLCPGYWQLLGEGLHFGPPPPGRSIVDLHWEIGAIVFFYRLPYGPLRQQALPFSCHGQPVYVLSPEHLLINLCLNALKDCDYPLSRLLDLGLVLTRLSLNWPKLLTATRQFRCQRPVYLMLREVAHLAPHLVPPASLAELARYRPPFLEQIQLHGRLRYLTIALPSFYRHRSLRDWVTILKATLWPSSDYLVAQYSRPDRAAYFRQLLAYFFGEDQINPR